MKFDLPLPKLYMVEQHFDKNKVTDISATVQAELAGIAIQNRISPGQSVAITAGSRVSFAKIKSPKNWILES